VEPQADAVKPWYRYRWPWLLISIPLTSICVGTFYAWEAVHGADPMVQEQYYAAGQSINQVIEAGRAAQRLGLVGHLAIHDAAVTLNMTDPTATPLPPVLNLQLSHPTVVSLDQNVMLVSYAPGQYRGELKPSSAVRWDITLAAPDNRWSLSGTWVKSEGSSAELVPTDVREAAD